MWYLKLRSILLCIFFRLFCYFFLCLVFFIFHTIYLTRIYWRLFRRFSEKDKMRKYGLHTAWRVVFFIVKALCFYEILILYHWVGRIECVSWKSGYGYKERERKRKKCRFAERINNFYSKTTTNNFLLM